MVLRGNWRGLLPESLIFRLHVVGRADKNETRSSVLLLLVFCSTSCAEGAKLAKDTHTFGFYRCLFCFDLQVTYNNERRGREEEEAGAPVAAGVLR